MWDVFISHATEDKEQIARPLAEALKAAGLKVWYDEHTLTLGDSLSQSIDQGLSKSRYGIVILSEAFFAKAWPRRELDGLTTREVSSGKTILPIWHNINRLKVEQFSPTLADKVAVSTSNGIDSLVVAILQVINAESIQKPPSQSLPSQKPTRKLSWKSLAILITFVMMLVAGSQVYDFYQTKYFENLNSLNINGKWIIEATEKSPKTYLQLKSIEGKLVGTTEVLYSDHTDLVLSGLTALRKTGIFDGRIQGKHFSFTTKRFFYPDIIRKKPGENLIHHYEGSIEGNKLFISVQVEGGYYEEVTAERFTDNVPITD